MSMPASALTLADCDRTTHPSHGGEAQHRDLGAGRVFWTAWWSQEGVYRDLYIAECATGAYLRTRTHEERISDRAPFNRTDDALEVIKTLSAGSPQFFTLERLASGLDRIGRDIEIAELAVEPCACAAVYPDHRGDKHPFELDQ